MERFYLGSHKPQWLSIPGPPLFISARGLRGRRTLPRAKCGWGLDSGGFTELQKHGKWTIDPLVYALEARDWQTRIGRLELAAPQDWMCEPFMLRRTGLTIGYHQTATIENFLELQEYAPGVPWMPVVQGWQLGDYLHHIEEYAARGIDLTTHSTVGVGSVCRRQRTTEAAAIIRGIGCIIGPRLHGFGFKLSGIPTCREWLKSADSMAWSLNGRHRGRCGNPKHTNCANCREFALSWYKRVASVAGIVVSFG